jgi:hypothetical protein
MLFAPLPLASDPDHHDNFWARLFGRFMQGARGNAGRSIEETAVLAGMKAAEWSAIESGKLLPSTRQQLRSMTDALGMNWNGMAEIVQLCRGAWGLR